MTAGGRRRGGRRRRQWGETTRHLPPGPAPEGIDLVIGKIRADDEIVRTRDEEPIEDRLTGDFVVAAEQIAELTRPERDHLGRVVVDRRAALVGALVVAIVAALAFWFVVQFLNTPLPS
jgi:hypothetical protein